MNAETLLADRKYAQVASLLEKDRSPTALIQRAFALSFLQQEDQAASLVEAQPFEGEASHVHSLLAAHYASRQKLTSRLSVDDPAGKKWAKHYAGHPDFKPFNRLSATMIVKNEARHIARCIKSLCEVVDEIVLLDTGSSDDTVAIATQAAKDIPLIVGKFDWCDDFAAARNAALALATGDWGLWIDADEELLPEGIGEIRQAVIRPHFGGFHLRIVNFTGEEGDDSTYTHAPLRLYRLLPETTFCGRIHEQVAQSLSAHPLGTLETATLLHYGYRPSEMAEKGKHERFLTMLEREVTDRPNDAFQWFNLANAYTLSGRWAEAEHAARSSVKLSTPETTGLALTYQLYANALTMQGKPEAALIVIEEARSKGCEGLFTEFEAANACIRLGRPDEALAYIKRAFTFQWDSHMTGDYTLFSFKRHVVKGQILLLLGRADEALTVLDEALEINPSFPNTLFYRASALAALGRLDEASALFRRCVDDSTFGALALTAIGQIFAAQGQFVAAASAFEHAWSLDRNNYDAWSAWAEACEAAQDLHTVVRAYSAFAQTNEPSPEVLMNWGRALERAGQTQRALDCFTEAMQRAPENANGYFNAGDLLFRHGQYQDSAHLYEAGLRIKSDYPAGWFVLGNSLAHLGLMDGAKIAYEQTLNLDPGHAEAKHNLGVVRELAAA